MRYDNSGKRGVGFPVPCHVVDAEGRVLTPCVSCDTDTGEATRYRVGPDRRVLEHSNGHPKLVTSTYPAPLRVVHGPAPLDFVRAPFPPEQGA